MSGERVVLAPRLSDSQEAARFVERAERRGFRHFLLSEKLANLAPTRDRAVYRIDAGRIVGGFGGGELREVPIVRVDDPADAVPAERALRAGRPVALRWTHERVIPLENLVAARSTPGTLWVFAPHPDQIPGFLGALEHGADVVIAEIDSIDELGAIEAALERIGTELVWEELTVSRVAPAGSGDRVIVDTTSLLRAEEGLLIGSQARVLLHVASEAVGSRYTRPRPFRVNAGAAHSYTLLANGETRYLSEVVAGDSVVVATPRGRSRTARVGRLKIERRPLVLVEVEREGRRFTAFLQEAETVRVSTAGGRVATTELKSGARVFAVLMPAARHLGQIVDESIEER